MTSMLHRDVLVQELKDVILEYWTNVSNQTLVGLNSRWLSCTAGEIYVRVRGFHAIQDVVKDCFDFANLSIRPEYQGQGIMLEVIEWWHTQHTQPVTYIESIINPEFQARLEQNGWIRTSNRYDVHMYKLTGHK